MGLALLDVADVIRPYPEIIDYLEQAKDDHFWISCLHLMAGSKLKTRSWIFLTNMACDVLEKSI